MKVTYIIARMKMFLAIMLCLFAISSCISDGDETVVLETGKCFWGNGSCHLKQWSMRME